MNIENIELDLITACINRERKAEYELYKRTYGYLMIICRRYANSKEEAKEILNVGFFRILSNLEKYHPEIPFKTWVRKIMINVLIDEYRKNKKHDENIEYVEEYFETQSHSELNAALSKMDMASINNMIVKLPPRSREVFNLFVIDGYSHKEISEMLGMSVGTTKWHLNFSKTQLKEMIVKLGFAYIK
ncbi:MAG TPA: sigma-70 family RNA polymerase sigma factor [Bacteroidia bacterium]|jgi:RNA polymerase sigma factor (sigma-70 family)|nr:sigma-70 family RNA polymerase sigma factor [Bacteroidia bacterium]